jgi:Ca2+-binding RTX toxin-like protein
MKGTDTLNGNEGDDVLDGAVRVMTTLYGGTGSDTFVLGYG